MRRSYEVKKFVHSKACKLSRFKSDESIISDNRFRSDNSVRFDDIEF